ncbi:MAG: hypothetical protein R3C26_06205 [Calditrichia bacterium]
MILAKTVACLTGMEQPLGNAIGNWLEVKESLECLNGEGPDDLRTVTVRLAAHMLVAGGSADSVEAGEKLAKRALSDGPQWRNSGKLPRRRAAMFHF